MWSRARRRPLHPRGRVGADEIWGMGIASHDLTGDGLPEVFLTSQGDNKLQTLPTAPAQPPTRTSPSSVGLRRTGPIPATTRTRRPPGTPVRTISTTTADRSLRVQGKRRSAARLRRTRPEQPVARPARWHIRRGGPRAGLVDFARGRGAALVDLDLDGMLDLVEVVRREPVRVWHNVGWATRRHPADGKLGPTARRAARTKRRCHRGLCHSAAGGLTIERGSTVGGGHAGGQLGWLHFGLGDAEGPRSGCNGPTAKWSVDGPAGQRLLGHRARHRRMIPWKPPNCSSTVMNRVL